MKLHNFFYVCISNNEDYALFMLEPSASFQHYINVTNSDMVMGCQ